MQQGLFRKKAFEKLSSPEQLDSALVISGSVNWMVIIGFALLALSLFVWGIFGRISTVVMGQGIIMRPGGITRVMSVESGQILDLFIEAGDRIEGEEIVGEIRAHGGEVLPITSTHTGRVLEVFVYSGDVVIPGSPLFSIELVGDGEELETILFMPAEEGQKVHPGMEAFIAPLMVNREEYGYIIGEVSHVSRFPSTFEGVRRVLGNEDLAMRMVGEIVPVQVRIQLIPDDTPSGFRWTSGVGPDTILSSGILCQGRITVERERPIALVFPVLR